MGEQRFGGFRSPRAVLLLVVACAALALQPSAGQAQVGGPGSQLPPEVRARVCQQLDRLAALLTNPAAGQVVNGLRQRYGCTGTPTTVVPGTTTTTIFVDCPLPGGGVGPCPTSTTLFVTTSNPNSTFPTIVPTTLPPCPSTTMPSATTTTLFPTTTIPTCFPPTTPTLPPGPTTTLGPCPSTTFATTTTLSGTTTSTVQTCLGDR